MMMKWRSVVWWMAAAVGMGAAWAQEEEPLDVDVAFVPPKVSVSGQTLRAEWDIAKGYYLYREKFKFVSATPNVTLEAAKFPKGKMKHDETFGDVETYRKHVAVTVPFKTSGAASLKLKITYQGCADIGLCYPPQTRDYTLNLAPAGAAAASPLLAALPATPAVTPAPKVDSLLGRIGKNLGLGGGARDGEPLPVEQVFILDVSGSGPQLATARWTIADGVYLYRDKIKIASNTPGVTVLPLQFPPGKQKEDAAFGKQEVYLHELNLPVALSGAQGSVSLTVNYQGCAEIGFCYPPQTRTVDVVLPATGAAAPAPSAVGGAAMSEQDRIVAKLATGNIFLIILSFFGFGLLLSFTPCVFPMIPILSSIIVGQGAQTTTRRAFIMSLVYVLAMAITYTVAGVLAGLFGSNLQAAFQNPWILGSFATVFVLLSLSMFGFYDLQMPAFIQTRLTEFSNKQQGGTLIGVGVMGFLSALIVGPCVAAPLAGALIFIGQTGNAVLGGVALFAMSLGMGVPLLAIGVSAGKLLPKAGGWMDTVKAVFGVVMLGVAIWMVSRILPGEVTMVLWAVLFIVSAVYMGAMEPVPVDGTGWRRLWKGTGLVALIYGTLLLIGALGGSQDMLQPLRGIGMGSAAVGNGSAVRAESHEKLLKRITTEAEFDRELQAASAAGKPLMLDFYADWCVSCKEFEKFTFSDPAVQQEFAKGVLIQADVTSNDDNAKALQKRFRVVGPPSLIFFGADGKERPQYRVVGFMPAKAFAAHVHQAFAP